MSVQQLKTGPSAEVLSQILKSCKKDILNNSTDSKGLELYSALIEYTIPEVYGELSYEIRAQIIDVTRTIGGLGALLSRISSVLPDDLEEGMSVQVRMVVERLLSIVARILMDNGIKTIHERIGPANAKERNLFVNTIYGSKLFNVLSRASVLIGKWGGSSDTIDPYDFGKLIAESVIQLNILEGLEKGMKIGAKGSPVLEGFSETIIATPSYRTVMLALYKRLRASQQWFCLSNIILPVFLESCGAEEERAHVLEPFSKGHHEKLYQYPESQPSVNSSLCRLCIKMSKPTRSMVQQLIGRWGGDPLAVKHNPIPLQETQTTMLLLSLWEMSDEDCQQLAYSAEFLNSVTNRLAALSSRARIFGTVFAEELTKRTSRPLKFDLTVDKEEQDRLRFFALTEEEQDAMLDNSSHDTPVKRAGDSDDDENDEDNNPTSLANRSVSLPSYALAEDDPEDSDDEPDLSNKERLSPPVYIKTLIEYLSADDNYQKQHLSLVYGPGLVKRKMSFGKEMEFYGIELATVVAGLKDNFDMDNFESMRLNLLVEVAKMPRAGKHLAKLLFSGDFSLQQRMVILTSIALAVQAGCDNTISEQVSKRLPDSVHELFEDSPVDSLARRIQSSTISETADKADDLIGGPKVLRISRHLAKERELQNDKSKNQNISTSEYAGNYYFFPLMAEWWVTGGANMGHYSQLLIAHFFKTLGIIMTKAKQTDIPDMTGELLDLIMSMRSAAKAEPVVLDGVLTALAVILQSNDHQLLVTHWPTTIVEIKSWLEDIWESVPDEKIQRTAAAILYQLVEIIDKWSHRLLGL